MSLIKAWQKKQENDLKALGKELKSLVKTPAIIILTGEMGAGKTTFVREISETHEFSSPTYSLIQESGDTAHADLYRIQDPEELVHLELELYLEDKNYFFVEWGKDYLSYLQDLLVGDYHYFELVISINNNSRTYELREL